MLARAALLGARGNSGVILSQMLRAYVGHLAGPDAESAGAQTIAAAMGEATDASYAAVGAPVEGTILSVARAASDAALAAAEPRGARPRRVHRGRRRGPRGARPHAASSSRCCAQAGVVDAGGRGLCVVLDAVETTADRPPPDAVRRPIGTHLIPVAGSAPERRPHRGRPGLRGDVPPRPRRTTEDAVATSARRWPPLGDSLVVVGGDGLWNVHVHVDDVGAAIEAGITAGPPHRIRVTHFAEQVAAPPGTASRTRAGARSSRSPRDPGLAALFESAGAVVVPGGPGQRPSTGQLLEAITSCGAAEVVVLPNDGDTVRAARDRRPHGRGRARRLRRGDPDPGPGAGPGRDLRARARARRSTPTSAR